ncbi:hypothetical protein BRARA_A01018 [Brassica rapa]|uniref:DUF4283 domain-containing protein n=1 Tax=Brassica campestris TaxID=3711 RepID=A0A398AKB8_BRACM|nr:hypothetical protein BRARA_A01018 [Brassica rapa]
MADNIRRALQDVNLGCDDTPFVLPSEVVRQAAGENRFLLIGRPVMPRKQNIRAIVASMPRNWGFDGLVRGRIIEGRRFQFVFPSEEAMEGVLRRGPWAFAERMLVLQRWSPLMDMALLNYIPFWIQVRGIPFQFTNREVIVNIARLMGQYIQMDYNEETGGRQEFVRIRLNWDVSHPLKFQRNFQFTPGVNTLLRFYYERLRGFCETCGLITHDSGACLVRNGGPDQDDDGNGSGDDNEDVEIIPNQGEVGGAPDGGIVPEGQHEEGEPVEDDQAEYERNFRAMEEEADDEELWTGDGMRTMYTDETEFLALNMEDTSMVRSLKRKAWLADAKENNEKFGQTERGEPSGSKDKRKRSNSPDTVKTKEDDQEMGTSEGKRGAVGPEPPRAP